MSDVVDGERVKGATTGMCVCVRVCGMRAPKLNEPYMVCIIYDPFLQSEKENRWCFLRNTCVIHFFDYSKTSFFIIGLKFFHNWLILSFYLPR